MDDRQIVDLYNSRNENAISETAKKYGRFLYSIAYNLLSDHRDSEEILNETYFKTWNSIPPQQPNYLSAFLGKITRNLSINHWYKKKAKKRNEDMTVLIAELGEIEPSSLTLESEIEMRLLVTTINDWLDDLPEDSRVLFMRRYWYGEGVKDLAEEIFTSPNKLAGRLYRLRQGLKKALEEEGFSYEG